MSIATTTAAKFSSTATKAIKHAMPKAFVLETVDGILSASFADVFNEIITELKQLGYDVQWQRVNTLDHGLPQSRKRVYIVGLRTDVTKQRFSFPVALDRYVPMAVLLDSTKDANPGHFPPASMKNDAFGHCVAAAQDVVKKVPDFDVSERPLIVDIGCTRQFRTYTVDVSPTITAKRGCSREFWLLHLGRQISLDDICKLQGIPPDFFDLEASKVSDRRLGHMIGNCMSINVLERILPAVLHCVGIRPTGPNASTEDTWAELVKRFPRQNGPSVGRPRVHKLAKKLTKKKST
jgi:site-specific DNA-cytosine methylase